MKKKHVRISLAALDELHAAASWYDAQSDGLGDRFLDATLEALDLVAGFPNVAPPARGIPKRLLARSLRIVGFPYAVIYRDDAKEVRVFAIAHTSRAPGYWSERL